MEFSPCSEQNSQNRVLSHFQFAQRFYLNIIYREQFQWSI